MTKRGSGSDGPNPQVFVLITGIVALLGIPVGLMLAGSEPVHSPADRGTIPKVAPVSATALVPAAAAAPADAPVVTVRELPARHPSPMPAQTPQKATAKNPAPVVSAPGQALVASTAPVTKPRVKKRRAAKEVVLVRRRTAPRHAATDPPPVATARHSVPVERKTYAADAPAEPRAERTVSRPREYASRETDASRERPKRERPKRERPRHREASRPKEPEAFGAGNSGFHYGASYDPYSMHVGR